MDVQDQIIRDTRSLLRDSRPVIFPYREALCAAAREESQVLLLRETAFELGGRGQKSAAYTCVSSTDGLVEESKTLLYGPELSQIQGPVSYARIIFVRTDDIGREEQAYHTSKDIELLKYSVYPEGFMIRASSMEEREQVRVGRQALKAGLTFEQVGNLFIRTYLEHPRVQAVQVLFLVGKDAEKPELNRYAEKNKRIRKALNKIMEKADTECSTCGLREICDEVEGLRKLHFQDRKR